MKQDPGYISLTVKKIEEPIRGYRLLTLEPSAPLRYSAGQYLTLVFRINQLEIRRSYSLLSPGDGSGSLVIGVRRIDNGVVSRILHDDIREGDILKTSGTGGLFTLPENVDSFQTLIFFAAGSGITPIYALIRYALKHHPHLKLVLIYSNSSAASTLLISELKKLREDYPARFAIEFLFSEAPLITQARLNRENLLTFLDKYGCVDVQRILFFVCGPQSYMNKVIFILHEKGIPSDNIRRENFVTDKARAIRQIPPDTGTHEVEILYNGYTYSVHVEYPSTILQAARLHDIQLPYSCEAGSCGNCIALCTVGSVWHSRNEVLTDKDLQEGKILTCSAHPVEDVRISV